jgi:hypothetical protein
MKMKRIALTLALFLTATANLPSPGDGSLFAQDAKPQAKKESQAESKIEWKKLLPASGLEGWESTNFGGEGEVQVKEGVLTLMPGGPLTGITKLGKDFPTENFEMQWSAQRIDGSDFFVGITFPVGKEHCSLIVGGWGGGLVGISSIDGNDASENETASFRNFKNGQWYDEQILEVPRQDRKFSVRAEVMRSRPLGYCSYQSKVAVKDWVYRSLETK